MRRCWYGSESSCHIPGPIERVSWDGDWGRGRCSPFWKGSRNQDASRCTCPLLRSLAVYTA
eukprot:scaffold2391_cov124-Isochrysis_galbana.AAC.1